ncbi:hypothetical protein KASIA_p087 [Shewanella phage vB_SspS_KASIA]|nr:hypothetical protein KASIA_p087 [Shewanella phage vB_SspS_KASIA]
MIEYVKMSSRPFCENCGKYLVLAGCNCKYPKFS